MSQVRSITPADLSSVAQLGLDKTLALRAMAQDMAWLADDGSVRAAATARLADGTVFLDGLVGEMHHRLALIDHAIAYARWSFAPAVTLESSAHPQLPELRGFIGVGPAGLPPDLARAGKGKTLLMKRL